ncbi:MAG: B12-binding domain-containing radical SAM protein, partial [Nitrospina sp.]|nr:B12-binding domain-containing radical SAM protein [Nitrospina sp.]
MKSVDVDIDKADVENIFEQLKYEKFSGKIGFLNPESRSRAILQNGPHVGLMLLMGVCRDLSIDYGFIDQDVYMLSNDEVISIIKKEKFDYLGVPLVSLRAQRIFPFLERIKRETGVKLIVGGPLPGNDCEWLMNQCRAIDYAVTGEGEAVLPLLLLAIEQNKPLDEIGGLAYWENDKLKTIPKSKDYIHGSIVPMPDFTGFDFKYYPGSSPVGAWPSVNLYANRGCPYACTFCGNSIWLHKPNIVPVPKVMEWLHTIVKMGAKEAFFVDDILNTNHAWFEELCQTIIKHKFNEKLIFRCLTRADFTSPEQFILAKKAGFWMMTFGVESGSPEVLKYYKKGESIDDIAQAIDFCNSAGIKSLASFIAGAPIDTVDTLLETANFIRQVNPSYAPVQLLFPFFGAPLTDDIVKRGLLTPEEIRDYDHTDHIIRTETLSTKELVDLVDYLRIDFAEFKKSPYSRMKRVKALEAQGLDKEEVSAELAFELEDAAFQDRHVVGAFPKAIMLDKRTDLSEMAFGDVISMDTPDIRLSDAGWHEREKGLRWSRTEFEIPFHFKKEISVLQVSWAAMRENAKVEISFNEKQTLEYEIESPGWRIDNILIPMGLKGTVWVKFKIPEPFFAVNDSRELGIAFKRIEFLKNAPL